MRHLQPPRVETMQMVVNPEDWQQANMDYPFYPDEDLIDEIRAKEGARSWVYWISSIMMTLLGFLVLLGGEAPNQRLVCYALTKGGCAVPCSRCIDRAG